MLLGVLEAQTAHPSAGPRALRVAAVASTPLRIRGGVGYAVANILSAKYGVVDPDQELAPYDLALTQLSPAERAASGSGMVEQLSFRMGSLSGRILEIHAGGRVPHRNRYGVARKLLTLTWKCPLLTCRSGSSSSWYRRILPHWRRLTSVTPLTAPSRTSPQPHVAEMAIACQCRSLASTSGSRCGECRDWGSWASMLEDGCGLVRHRAYLGPRPWVQGRVT